MKLRMLFPLILLCSFSLTVKAVDDDCPCRRRLVKKVEVRKQPEVRVVKVPIRRSPLFLDLKVPDENLCRGTLRERQNFKVKIMPNPVLKRINVIYNTEDGMNVKIELYSCTGKLIKVLMNKIMYGPDLKESSFDINGLVPRGDAYIKLTSGAITKLEKIFIL